MFLVVCMTFCYCNYAFPQCAICEDIVLYLFYSNVHPSIFSPMLLQDIFFKPTLNFDLTDSEVAGLS